jgi:hypothetical protein
MSSKNHGIVIHSEHALYAAQLLQLLNLWAIQIYPISRSGLAVYRQPDDAVGRWKWIHQRGINNAENRRSCSYAQSQRDYRRQSDSGIPEELACCVPEIMKQGLHSPFLAA